MKTFLTERVNNVFLEPTHVYNYAGTLVDHANVFYNKKAEEAFENRGSRWPVVVVLIFLFFVPRKKKIDWSTWCMYIVVNILYIVMNIFWLCFDRFSIRLLSTPTLNARMVRLQSSEKTLFHQTNNQVANIILRSQTMLRGKMGLAGGGIYFAETAVATNHKAHQKGRILKCQVRLGKIYTVGQNGNPSITHQSLLKSGYDSVKIPRLGGVEYVVYNSDQVYNIQ